ncbi:MAG: surface lipoprotein assembly modifier [Cardiobacteriaceae bacterium]|nr:surface lipoprotein assembly modifier [Cardiobacteriaceae bacterium]
MSRKYSTRALLALTISTILSQSAFAQERSNPKAQYEAKTKSALESTQEEPSKIQQRELNAHILAQNKLSTESPLHAYTDEDLSQNQELLEKVFLMALIQMDRPALEELIKLYQPMPNRDDSLIDWANAIIISPTNREQSISEMRKLISHFPDNDYIRFQLATFLFFNEEFIAAKDQFEKTKSSNRLKEADRKLIDEFITVIDNKDRWNFNASATFLNDKNLSNSAPVGTKMLLPNGGSFTQSTPLEEGRGFALNLGADKRFSLGGGRYISLELGSYIKHYWNNKKYNEIIFNAGVGYGLNYKGWNIEVSPNISRRLYGGGSSGDGKQLHAYYTSYGINTYASTWVNPKIRYSLNYSFDYDKYDRDALANRQNGATHSISNSITYIASPKQYWSASLNLAHRNSKDDSNSYNRIGGNIAWGQEWPMGFSSRLSLGLAQRNYSEMDFFQIKQKNKEYSAGLSIWNKALHYQGLTPRLTWSYNKTDSSIPFYSYDKHQIFLEVSKTF